MAGAIAFAGLLGAQAQQPPTGAPQQRNPDAIKTVLDLSDRQFAEMTELRDAHQAKLKEYSDENRTLEQSKRAIMQASGADPVKIGSITLRQDALSQMIKQENEAYHIGSLALLTATQRDKVTAIEEALKLAPSAGALMQFGLLDPAALGGRGGFMGMAPGQGFGGQGGQGGGQGGPGMMIRGGPPPQN